MCSLFHYTCALGLRRPGRRERARCAVSAPERPSASRPCSSPRALTFLPVLAGPTGDVWASASHPASPGASPWVPTSTRRAAALTIQRAFRASRGRARAPSPNGPYTLVVLYSSVLIVVCNTHVYKRVARPTQVPSWHGGAAPRVRGGCTVSLFGLNIWLQSRRLRKIFVYLQIFPAA